MRLIGVVALALTLAVSVAALRRSREDHVPRRPGRGRLVVREAAWLVSLCTPVAVTAFAFVWLPPLGRSWSVAVVALAGTAAATGGGPVAMSVIRLSEKAAPGGSVPAPAAAASAVPRARPAHLEHLPGSAWLGFLERLVTYSCLVFGWPEGVAALLLLKSWGRQEAFKNADSGQRFMIGTLTSVLWAAGLAGVAWWARR